MNAEPTIICPKCSTEIKLTESLAAPLIQSVRKQYEAKIEQTEADVAKREAIVRAQQEAVKDAQKAIEAQVAEEMQAARVVIAQEEARKAKRVLENDLDARDTEIGELQAVLKQRDQKLKAAQKEQADLLRKKRALDDDRRELELTVEKRVQASADEIRKQAEQEAAEGLKLKVAEKEVQISSMQRQIQELKQKAEQGSQQFQGEAMELELEATLRSTFPLDGIEPVPKGEYGGDVLQKVLGPAGQECGSILWESKRTRNWSDGWLPKLRNDQRTAKAELAVLLTQAMPRGMDSFGHVDGIWITHPRYAVPLVIVLRQLLIEVANTRQVQEGQETKMALVYQYFTGPKFRHRVEAIVEKFTDMQADLERERKSMTRLWAKREAQIHGVIESTVGMYGDLQGIAGRALREIEGLETPLLESDRDAS